MYKVNAFIVDNDFLEKLESNSNIANLANQMDFRNIQQYFPDESDNLHLTFAVSSEKIDILQSVSYYFKIYNGCIIFSHLMPVVLYDALCVSAFH